MYNRSMNRFVACMTVILLASCTAPLIESDGVMLINEAPAHPNQLTKGRPALLVYWSTTCESCEAIMAYLEELHGQVPQLAILGINNGDDQVSAETWWNEHALTFPSFIDPKSVLAEEHGIVTIPTLLFRDEFQATIMRLENGITEESIDAGLIHMLKNQYIELPTGSGS